MVGKGGVVFERSEVAGGTLDEPKGLTIAGEDPMGPEPSFDVIDNVDAAFAFARVAIVGVGVSADAPKGPDEAVLRATRCKLS